MSPLLILDVSIFFIFLITVVAVGIIMSRGEDKGSESYFLAGRGLGWCLVGFSLIASNISTEQFVGMSGQASDYFGLAIASYEWMAAVTLVIVAFLFLPQFLKAGIYTIPEFLEKRYNKFSRTIMSLIVMATLVTVNTAAVIFSGAKTYAILFQGIDIGGIPLNIVTISWVIGILAASFVFFGGLKACAWADLIQGSALIVGGAIVLFCALYALGIADPNSLNALGGVSKETAEQMTNASGWTRFHEINANKLRMNLPWSDSLIPITALMIGLWIPNLYYWGLNQFIMQRTLGSKSLSEGQKGIVFAAVMKLIVPFIIVFPGIIAFNIYSSDMKQEASENNNKAILANFDSLKGAPKDSKTVFPFKPDFAEVYPEEAEQILAFNAAVVGVDPATLTVPEKSAQNPLYIKNENVLSQLAAKKLGRWEETKMFGAIPMSQWKPDHTVSQQLMGYDHDAAFPLLMKRMIPHGVKGFMYAAILGAVICALASMLNAASTIFVMDIYREYLHKKASEKTQVFVGRLTVIACTIIACLISPLLGRPEFKGIFSFIQEFQGFISPGILGVFLFGFLSKRGPGACGPTALIASPVTYGLLKWVIAPNMAFLDRMAVTIGVVFVLLFLLRIFFPRSTPYETKSETNLDMRSSKTAKVVGVMIILVTAGLYAYFWDYNTPMFEGFGDWIQSFIAKK